MIGEVDEFYFDDESWKIRYLVIKTGSWLSERKVLISPDAIIKQPWQNGFFPVLLTKQQVQNSPDIDTEKPVSRLQETELYSHYQWENYWGSGFYAGGSMGVSMPFPSVEHEVLMEPDKDKTADNYVHLRSTERVSGYHIHATDGEIGHVDDFIVHEETWQITAIVVDTSNWFGGKKIVIPVAHIKKIDWSENLVFLNMVKASIDKHPLFEKDNYPLLPLYK